ncbi:AAA family ATPase [Paenibacillus xylanilyticus]|uniref:AAA family ATPase n=1 Tax=Paenibacillus xylanilyticus TaxID=248903 RepID=A0A7Y6BWY1_9BACL|nr:AAA family ATPase [Paenibacillus xylanilyticus]
MLITGMSGTGKSTALTELARKGHRVVDTDYGEWSENLDGTGWLWNEDRIMALLMGHNEGTLFLSGTVSNQGKFYSMFDAIVLLSAPLDVILERVSSRHNNPYGKTQAEREEIIHYVHTVEPLLRAGSTFEIDTRKSIEEVTRELEQIATSPY